LTLEIQSGFNTTTCHRVWGLVPTKEQTQLKTPGTVSNPEGVWVNLAQVLTARVTSEVPITFHLIPRIQGTNMKDLIRNIILDQVLTSMFKKVAPSKMILLLNKTWKKERSSVKIWE
jgi:hypothetical protein